MEEKDYWPEIEGEVYSVIYTRCKKEGTTIGEIAKELELKKEEIRPYVGMLLSKNEIFPYKKGYITMETPIHVVREAEAILAKMKPISKEELELFRNEFREAIRSVMPDQ